MHPNTPDYYQLVEKYIYGISTIEEEAMLLSMYVKLHNDFLLRRVNTEIADIKRQLE